MGSCVIKCDNVWLNMIYSSSMWLTHPSRNPVATKYNISGQDSHGPSWCRIMQPARYNTNMLPHSLKHFVLNSYTRTPKRFTDTSRIWSCSLLIFNSPEWMPGTSLILTAVFCSNVPHLNDSFKQALRYGILDKVSASTGLSVPITLRTSRLRVSCLSGFLARL